MVYVLQNGGFDPGWAPAFHTVLEECCMFGVVGAKTFGAAWFSTGKRYEV